MMRQQTFITVSPYLDKASGYEKFKNRWRFGWETVNIPEMPMLTSEEVEAIRERHSKFIKPKK